MITSSRHDKERNIKRKKLLGIIFGVVLLILIFRSPFENMFSGVLHFIARPFLIAGNSTRNTLSEYTFLLQTKSTLVSENRRLQDALDLTLLDSLSREALRNENETLKAMFNRHEARTLILARVLANPGFAPYDTLIIDVGSREGITPNMKVFVESDFVIGEVTSVFAHSALVTLYSSNGNEIPVTIHTAGTSSIPTMAYGIGGGNLRSILPKGLNISVGDLVDIPAIAPEYVGTIDSLTRPEGTSLQTVYMKLPINVFTLRYVYVATRQEIPTPSTE